MPQNVALDPVVTCRSKLVQADTDRGAIADHATTANLDHLMGAGGLDRFGVAVGNRRTIETSEERKDAVAMDDLQIVQFNATYQGFGMVMDYVARRMPFAGFEAGTLTDALHQQLKLGHNLVAIRNNKLVGYAGWLMTSKEIAEAWLADRGKLVRKDGVDATAAVLTIVIGDDEAAVPKLIRGARRLNPGRRAYFKRGADQIKPARKRSLPA